jgi:NDP-sugar pyrophosphorylase family protein
VGDKPVLQHQLELAATFGATDVRIFEATSRTRSLNCRRWLPFGLRVTVEVESQPLGNAGAVLQKLDLLDDQFLVLYGDLMAAVDLSRFSGCSHSEQRSFHCLCSSQRSSQDSDLVEVNADNHVTRLHLKPIQKVDSSEILLTPRSMASGAKP